MFALPAGTNFKVRDALIIDLGRQEQFPRVIADRAAVGEFDNGQSIVKDFEASFLAFPRQDMPDDEHRLSLALGAEVS